ncbi:elongation factor P maturation arginine rhamnosyltransferase EarP, partial [Fusobacterium necrophorum]|uniref:elongation factor P maturation arginine rhamnosyltransferase EarP n=1 Tax=Fusobacterium necrophorum TaxID=859 RepID=UPI00254B679E
DYELVGSIFSYEKDFSSLLESLQKTGKKICLCILGEKSQESLGKSLGNFTRYDKIKLKFLPFYSQENYEALIQKCDFNFVRGEDSFARALLTGKPFLWHIYPQKNGLHFQKLQSFLEKYCPDNPALQNSFYSYNREETDYSYFWEHLADIQKHNEEFRDYIRKHCNLGIKLKQFIENF